MRLDLLPAELQLEVFSHLENIDLKAARAVSRQLRDNASPALFRSVVACARYVALGTFQKISLDSVLQKYVKEIVFDGSVYNREVAQNQDTYERQNGKYDELQASSSFWNLRTRWKRYQELYNEQEDLKASDVLLQSMARALEWTTNVSSIVYSPHPHLLPPEAKLMRDLVPRDFRLGYWVVVIMSRNEHHINMQHPFLQLVGAIYLSQYTGVRELRIEPFRESEPGSPFTIDFFDLPDATHVQAGRHLFRHLERCELNLKIISRDDDTAIVSSDDGGRSRLAHLSHLLAAADDLRHLAFHIVGWRSTLPSAPFLELGPGQPVFSRLGLCKTWPKLRSLSLKGVHSEGDDFLDFIKRHKSTLRSLSIQDCALYTGIWADIVDEVVYTTRISPFVLNMVNEERVPTGSGDGLVHSSQGLDEWLYEGHLEVSQNGERRFVELVPNKKSVYFRIL